MTRPWGCAAAALIAAFAMAAGAPAAFADGDPASDVLLSQAAFLPADGGFPAAQQSRLTALLRAAARGGHPVRVAIIPDNYDLGSITVLWRKPETYARFLGAELSLVYPHPLVVVMPNGVGLNWPGHSVVAARRQLAGLAVTPGSAGLLHSATSAVHRVLSAEHADVSPAAVSAAAKPASHSAGSQAKAGSGGATVAIIVGALVVLLAGGLFAYRRRRGPARDQRSAGAESGGSGRPLAVRRRWLVPAGLGVAAVAIGTPILLVTLLRGSPAAAGPRGAIAGTPYTLPEGRQAAPNFVLRDQNGRPVSPAAFRGRDVLLTFADPLCRNLCPLEAHVLNALVDELPAAQRPVIIAVSVDVYADTRHDLLQDFRRWSLVPQWHWAVGSHAQLASVWKNYAVSVNVVTKRLAGTTVHYIAHSEQSYLIDQAGYERALFAWPFSSQDVLATLRRMARSEPAVSAQVAHPGAARPAS